MQISQGSLVIVGANTPQAQVFWNGVQVPFVKEFKLDWEADEQRVKLKVTADDAVHAELRAAGVNVKLEVNHG